MDFFNFLCERPIYFLYLYLSIIILAAFIIFGIDKYKAIHGKRRISEATLITLCIIGGSLGGLAGMYVFHHKTLHKRFSVGIPVILLLQIVFAILIYVLLGS